MAALGSQTIADSYEQLLHVDTNGGGNGTAHVSVKDGDNGTTFGFTIASDALMMTGTNRLEFGDTGTYIHQSADGVLDLVSDTEIEINATTIDMNGAAELSGIFTVGVVADSGSHHADCNDAIIINGADAGTYNPIVIQENGNDRWRFNFEGSGSTNSLSMFSNASADAGPPVITFLPDGKIGAGTTTPSNDFVISDYAAATGNGIEFGIGSSSSTITVFNRTSSSYTPLTIETTGVTIAPQGTSAAGLLIDQDNNKTAFKIDSESTTLNCLTVEADALTSGSAGYFYSNSPSGTARRLFQIQNDNHDAADATVCLYILQDGNSDTIQVTASDASYTNNIQFLQASGRSSSDAFKFLECYTGGDTDVQHKLRGDGVTQNRSGTFEAADYAEYFESKDGKVIAIGSTVKLDGDKIVACEDGDNPLGVIRPLNTSLVGNSAWANWGSKYLTDDYGSPIMEEYSVTEWMEDTDEVKTEEVKAQDGVEAKDAVLYKEGDELPEGKKVGDEKEAAVKGKDAVEAKAAVYKHKDIQYQTDKIPSDVTVPSDASVTSKEKDGSKLMRKKLNPDYDESKTYVEREKRDEWHIVGLLGQIPITKGQPVSSSWTKMKDVSDKVEMWMIK
jgi:hypothetical protein|tara:strand:- start:239 stop:2095 length:1857 start_codon:yes stop_codon:yes gene_type:complete